MKLIPKSIAISILALQFLMLGCSQGQPADRDTNALLTQNTNRATVEMEDTGTDKTISNQQTSRFVLTPSINPEMDQVDDFILIGGVIVAGSAGQKHFLC